MRSSPILLLAAGLALVCTGRPLSAGLGGGGTGPRTAVASVDAQPAPLPADEPMRQRTFSAWVPSFEVDRFSWLTGPLAVALGALAGGLGLWLGLRRRLRRVAAGLGLLALGVATAALGVAVFRGFQAAEAKPLLLYGEGPLDTASALTPMRGPGLRRWGLVAATRSSRAFQPVGGGSTVRIRWALTEQPCVERIGTAEIWRCGRTAPPFPEVLSRRRLVVLHLAAPRSQVEELALALLDSGSASSVVLGAEIGALRHALGAAALAAEDAQSQVLFLTDAPTAARSRGALAEALGISPGGPFVAGTAASGPLHLAAGLHFEGVRGLPAVWPDVKALAGDPARVDLQGLGTGPCRSGEILQEGCFTFVRICGGSLAMDPVEGAAGGDVRPARQMRVGSFWMARTEMTRDPCRAGENPVTYATWNNAQALCTLNGYRLPTEAEWESAARNVPDPRDLSDMHGNLSEWVNDRDDCPPPRGECRVVRGGSNADEPRMRQSTRRASVPPKASGANLGFRCVRPWRGP